MATIGKTATPNSSTHGYIQGTGDSVGMGYTMPAGGGLITSITFWAATVDSHPIYGKIWNSVGAVLAHGPGVTTSGGASHAPGPGGDNAWHTDTLATPLWVPGNTVIYIGWSPGGSWSTFWAYNGNDHSPNAKWEEGSYGPDATIMGGAYESPSGAVAAYATYTPMAAPTVTSFTPGFGLPGTVVDVYGTSFSIASGVSFDYVAATTWSIIDNGHIQATVPSGATTGRIRVSSPDGTGTSASDFLVGEIYADNATAFVGGCLVYADNGSAWVEGSEVWADDGATWRRIL